MPRGSSDIPDLRLSRLNKLVTKFQIAPNLLLMKMFPSVNSDSKNIKWESQIGTRGMAPFIAPGAKTPRTHPLGVAKHSAVAAFWGEKMDFDEDFLNNLRKKGTESTYQTARETLAKETMRLRYRCDRRQEFMFAKMISENGFDYLEKDGLKVNVSYGIPSDQIVTLTTNAKWGTGNAADIMGDVRDAKLKLQDSVGATRFIGVMTQTVLRYMAEDSTFQALFKNSDFAPSDGQLLGKSMANIFGIRQNDIGRLLDIDRLIIYDEKYEVESILGAVVTVDSTLTITVNEIEDFEVGEPVTFYDVSDGTKSSTTTAGAEILITAVSPQAGTFTIDGAPSATFKAGRDKVVMTKTFIDKDKFILMTPSVEGQAIAEYKKAPFGLDRHYGLKLDKHDEWDPDATLIRAQNKGLPVLYHPDAIYVLDVE